MKARNRELGSKLLMAVFEKRDTMHARKISKMHGGR